MIKYYITIILLLLFCHTQAQVVDIPDPYFKAALLWGLVVDTNGNGIGDSDADTNNDGLIQVSEAEAVQGLFVFYQYISSLEGIQSFTNLEELDCSENQLISLDLTFNLNLIKLNCSENQLIDLNITQNVNLEELNCSLNQLTDLNILQNSNLKILSCYFNQLTELTISHLTSLTHLTTYANPLNNIDVTQNENLISLYCINNQLSTLDVSQNSNLVQLECNYNQLNDIDISQNQLLEVLNVSNNQLTSIDVTQNHLLEYLEVYNNLLIDIDVTQNINLYSLSCYNNQLTSIDVSLIQYLSQLYCYNNQLTSLNVKSGNNIFLTNLYAWGNYNLECIQVDDVTFAINAPDWHKDNWTEYSEDCNLGIDGNSQISFTIYPNPVQDLLTIDNTINIEITSIKMYDLLGRLVLEENHSFNQLDVSALNSGLFLIKIETEQGVLTKKIIKE